VKNFNESTSAAIPTKIARTHRIVLWTAVATVMILILVFWITRLDIRCIPLVVRSFGDVDIPLPEGCLLTRQVPPDQMVQYLENDRRGRGLIFRAWITCSPLEPTKTRDFGVLHDLRWLPSYTPQTYQFRRIVLVFPYSQPIPRNSPVVAEVTLMPWFRYARQLSKQCDGKFLVWR
jgi:hypothetical protein